MHRWYPSVCASRTYLPFCYASAFYMMVSLDFGALFLAASFVLDGLVRWRATTNFEMLGRKHPNIMELPMPFSKTKLALHSAAES